MKCWRDRDSCHRSNDCEALFHLLKGMKMSNVIGISCIDDLDIGDHMITPKLERKFIASLLFIRYKLSETLKNDVWFLQN